MLGWDAGQYARFLNERTQPAFDLAGRIDLAAPRRIVDLGCGPGNSSEVLRARWPAAEITGIDFSPDMLAAARRDYPTIRFISGDIATWEGDGRYDIVFSNAALQWVGNHETLLPRLLDSVAAGGALAVQMPRNHDFQTHALMRRVAAEGPWRDRLTGARPPSPVKPPEFYYDCLASRGARLTLWETNYIQIMDDVDAVVAWLHGTGLRPFLSRLEPAEQPQFLARYRDLLAEALPPRANGKVLLPYPRIFMIATPG